MKTKRAMFIGAAFALLMTSGAAIAQGMPVHADDPWARAIGDTRTLEDDHIGCATQDNVKLVSAIQHNRLRPHQTMANALTVAPYPGGPTIGACQVAEIEAYRHSGLTPAEARTRGGDFTEAEWQAGMEAINQLDGPHLSFTQAECAEIINKQADIDNLLAQDHQASIELPAGCMFFQRGEEVVIIKLEYSASGSCGIAICAQIHLVGDMRRYWVDAPVELYEAK